MFPNPTSRVDRLVALTDGVCAIVITLLVLDLKVPEIPGSASNPQLLEDLTRQIPNFFAYVISFIVIAYFWLNHHRLFRSVNRCDEKALMLNLLSILFLSLIPYTTSLIGHYKDDQIAVILFSANIGLAALAMIRLHIYVSGKTQWHDSDHTAHWVPAKWWGLYFGPLLSVVCIAVSFVSVPLSLGLWLLLPLRNFAFMRWLPKSS
jgi:uncharacterized membrane protein